MRIAQVAPLFESVPPKYYGGTERIVSYLTEELVRQGHDVTLFASGDSVTRAHLVTGCRRSLRLDKHCVDQMAHHVLMLQKVSQRLRQVWPHDNALIAAGAARYGHGDLARQVMTGLFDASIAVDLHRLPELFCGFPRRQGESPTLYPVSCSPQAWASGSVLLLLQACLGLTLRAAEKKIMFTRPKLPEYLEQVRIENLRLADARVDLTLTRHRGDVVVDVPRREGRVEVMTVE